MASPKRLTGGVFDFDAELAAHLKGLIASQDAVLLGRVTYQEWASYWPTSANEPFASFINHTPKCVASTTMTPAAWRNTTLVNGNLAGLIARLKAQPGQSIGIHGSPNLVRSLLRDGLIDELRLAIPPVIAGTGQRLFDSNTQTQPCRWPTRNRPAPAQCCSAITRCRHDPPVWRRIMTPRSPNTPRRRRTMLRAGLTAAAAFVVAIAGLLTWRWSAADVNTTGKVKFGHRLSIPPLAPSHRDEAGRRVFDLRAAEGSTQFRPGPATPTWGINGDYLGPTLRASRGEKVLIHVRNDLAEPTTMHWHGMELPPAMDGGPHQVIQPGATWSPTWAIGQPAATLWYHPHPHGRTAEHVYRGLAGLFIIDEPTASAAALPHRYGVDDIPLIIQDKKFGPGNQLDLHPSDGDTGILGDTIAVNGTVGPYQEVTTGKVRLRILNASNARIYNFGLSGGHPFTLIGTDGGLLPAPRQVARMLLSPGDRAEIVVTMTPSERLVLRSYPPDLGTGFFSTRFAGGDDSFDILQLRATRHLAPSPAVPATLAPPPRTSAADAAATRTFELAGHRINGQRMDMGRIDFTAAAGSAEIWEVTNRGDQPHNFHIHGVQFTVLSVGGASPPPEQSGWQDTIYLKPGSQARLAVPLPRYADPHHPYMFHCHLLFHEDQGMMGQFVLTRPGQAPPSGEPSYPRPGHQH